MSCRFCGKKLDNVFIDLGSMAIANNFISKEAHWSRSESIYPLRVYVCDNCFLVQVPLLLEKHDIFAPDYVYCSSVSKSWLEHCSAYVEKMVSLFKLNKDSLVIEIGSNDGYMLQNFKQKHIPCLGIEPTQSTATIAKEKGIDTWVEFFDETLAERIEREDKLADLIIGNNVIAHVPGINNFVRGLKRTLKRNGVITLEFPHLLKMVEAVEFDTIYHEHFSYFSFFTLNNIFQFHGFEVFDVEELPTHGGSLRVFIKHRGEESHVVTKKVQSLIDHEKSLGVNSPAFYRGFHDKVLKVKIEFLDFLIQEKKKNKTIVGFGAAAKGNTFLNYCGIRSDLVNYVIDDTTIKQYKFLPQSGIPVFPIDKLKADKPDIILIIPWNFKDEILKKLEFTKEWGAQLVTYIPHLKIH